jgi:hypothetical protein
MDVGVDVMVEVRELGPYGGDRRLDPDLMLDFDGTGHGFFSS